MLGRLGCVLPRRVVKYGFHPIRTAVSFKLADIGEGIAEVEVLQWFVKEGDKVQTFDRICEVQSDKATVEITSRYSGIISKVHHGEGTIVKVGESLVDIEESGAPAAAVEGSQESEQAITTNSLGTDEIVDFKLADIGEGIAEVEMMKWFVKQGDSVRMFDKICEVQSDKATVEITSRYEGIVAQVHHVEGDIVKVGETLVAIQLVTGSAPQTLGGNPDNHGAVNILHEPELKTGTTDLIQSPGNNIPSRTSTRESRRSTAKFECLPSVRKLAKDNNIDLALVNPTGKKGRISKEDILNYIQNGPSIIPPQRESPSKSVAPPAVSIAQPLAFAEDKVVPIRGVQRLMVKSMSAALQVQHLTYCEEISFDKMKKFRQELKPIYQERTNLKLSYMPIMIKATSLALSRYPILNATVNDECTEMIYRGNHNIGIAMDTPNGLVVPVIKQVQNKSIFEIGQELAELQQLGASGQLTEAHFTGGSFSLSNIGAIGGTYMVPVVVCPQVAIGALGRLQTKPVYVDAKGNRASEELIDEGKASIAPMSTMSVSWSADHRVVDGATVARFSNLWKSYLENPAMLSSELR